MNELILWRIVRVFTAVAVVVAYSIGIFWIGTTVERRSLNSSLAGKNYELLQKDGVFNEVFKERQAVIGAAVAETLRLVKECRK